MSYDYMKDAYAMILEVSKTIKKTRLGFNCYDVRCMYEAETLDLTGWRKYLVPKSWEE